MSPVRGLAALVIVATLAALLLAGLNMATRERIVRNEAQKLLATLQDVLPDNYDNQPHLDQAMLTAPAALGSADALPVYRARRGGEPAGLVLTAVAPDGYVDAIRLLIGISAATRDDWILAFDGRNTDLPAATWALRRDGGDFDQLTGATITSRAVLNAVRLALEYYRMHHNDLYALPPTDAG